MLPSPWRLSCVPAARRCLSSPLSPTSKRTTFLSAMTRSSEDLTAAATPAAGGIEAMAEDPERKKKKEEKAKLKELKKLKAEQKAQKAAEEKALKGSEVSKKKTKKADIADEERDPPTPFGEKKQLAGRMAAEFHPALVEASWYSWWEKAGFFVADSNSNKPKFVMVIPPPNVTGVLHIGHALMGAIEDLIVRYRRMKGFEVLWVPGVDHAGIATQVVVEKKIAKEKLTRHDLGREKFVDKVWEWKREHGGTICSQLRRLGASVDWSRECFTMDEQRSQAVLEAFVRLHKDGLIYRDNRLVNWDCTLRTAISDIEVDYIELTGRDKLRVPGYQSLIEFGAITSFAYPVEDGGEIVVATTRPETMLGDTAVAVHPNDPRYKHLHGKFVIHPFNGRRLPIICDAELVDMEFGTGAVKITPAHDPNDFETGKRHNLEFINILTDDGRINSYGGGFEGLKRFDARSAVVKALEEKGLYRGVADNPMRLGICSRSSDIVEPIIKPQWYVRCKSMAAKACEAVRQGELEIVPSQFVATWFRWLEDIRDWCISRQLWWGHRIPAWYATLESDEYKEMGAYDDHWAVARSESEARRIVQERFPGSAFKLEQDPDVLDTWFSSGLFPFSVMGWPEQTKDLQTFYPTTLLETGHDILFFWVARMVMMGIQLTGELPFKKIFLHAMVRDAHGRKMSKSLGNVIDPLDVIHGISLDGLKEKLKQSNLDASELKKATEGLVKDFPVGIPECGSDALRFGLIAYTAQAENINLDIQRIVGYRHWCNKLWNATKFTMLNLGSEFVPSETFDVSRLPWSSKWVLSALNRAIGKINDNFEAYNFSEAATAVYSWWLYELCDVYIELTKPLLAGADISQEVKTGTRDTLWLCLEQGLRLLHPFMPFITEELWQRLPRKAEETSSIMLASYPSEQQGWHNPEVERQMDVISSIAKGARSLCAQYNLPPRQRPQCYIVAREGLTLEPFLLEIATLGNVSSVKVLREAEEVPAGCVVNIIDEGLSVHLMLEGVVNFEKELSKLQAENAEEAKKIEALKKKMEVANYKEKVPQDVQEADRNRLAKLEGEMQVRQETIQRLAELQLA